MTDMATAPRSGIAGGIKGLGGHCGRRSALHSAIPIKCKSEHSLIVETWCCRHKTPRGFS